MRKGLDFSDLDYRRSESLHIKPSEKFTHILISSISLVDTSTFTDTFVAFLARINFVTKNSFWLGTEYLLIVSQCNKIKENIFISHKTV